MASGREGGGGGEGMSAWSVAVCVLASRCFKAQEGSDQDNQRLSRHQLAFLRSCQAIVKVSSSRAARRVRMHVRAWVGGGVGESAALTPKVRQSVTGLPTVAPSSSAGVKGRGEGRSKGIAPAGKNRTKVRCARKHPSQKDDARRRGRSLCGALWAVLSSFGLSSSAVERHN